MTNIRCLIVDDEPIARQIVQRYCEHLPELQIVAVCSDALDARQVLMKENIDLMFLDINMPMLDGMAFMKTLKHPPQVIFTTAYKEFALEAFDLAACDYLLKPFSLDRFLVAVPIKQKINYLQALQKLQMKMCRPSCMSNQMGKSIKSSLMSCFTGKPKETTF